MHPYAPFLTPEIIEHIGTSSVGKALPLKVETYQDLLIKVAHLSYLNKDEFLFYRGQTYDFHNKAGVSTFYPSIYREDNISKREVEYQFKLLENASKQLRELLITNTIEGYKDVIKKRYIQWSILQHYNVCGTPLLDFTHSLRVACSFALQRNDEKEGFVYIFGLPYITSRISVNTEEDIVNIRLLSVCPPEALRPYFQEGYLMGTPDITFDYENKSDLDFNNRLIAKFSIPNTSTFWGKELSNIPYEMLFPKNDRFENICRDIEIKLQSSTFPGDIGEFLTEWVQLEKFLINNAGGQELRRISTREAIQKLQQKHFLNAYQAEKISEIRKFRNILVHEPNQTESDSISNYLTMIQNIRKEIKW
jgi:FRG domain/Protein of unknown function DUF86